MTPKEAAQKAGRLARERAAKKAAWEVADADFVRGITECAAIWAPTAVPFKVGDRLSHIPYTTGMWEVTAIRGRTVMSYPRAGEESKPVLRVSVSLQNVKKDGTLGAKYKTEGFQKWNADEWTPEGETYEPPDLSWLHLE